MLAVEGWVRQDVLEATFFAWHVKFDETSLRLRAAWQDGVKETQSSKLFVIESKWLAVLRPKTAQGFNDYITLSGACSPELRITDSGSGEGVCAALLSCMCPPSKATQVFRHVARLVDTDALPANFKAERLLRNRTRLWGQAWHLHLECQAHKIHQSAVCIFKMRLGGDVVTGLTNLALSLTSPANAPKLRPALKQVVAERLQRVQGAPMLSSRAREFRNRCLAAFCPDSHSGLVAVATAAAVVFNGDWQSGVLTHHCQGCRQLVN